MPLLDEETGRLTLGGGLTLSKGMSKSLLTELFGKVMGGKPHCDLTGDDILLPFPAKELAGGRLAPVCILEGGRLRAVRIWAVGAKDGRALLFSALAAKDPCPDTKSAVEIAFPFGTADISLDPRTGTASMLISYQ